MAPQQHSNATFFFSIGIPALFIGIINRKPGWNLNTLALISGAFLVAMGLFVRRLERKSSAVAAHKELTKPADAGQPGA